MIKESCWFDSLVVISYIVSPLHSLDVLFIQHLIQERILFKESCNLIDWNLYLAIPVQTDKMFFSLLCLLLKIKNSDDKSLNLGDVF